jgi:hypothetical protein
MSTLQFDNLPGTWSGTSRLFFEGKEMDSASAVEIRLVGQGQFLSVAYTWQYNKQPQDGLIIIPTALGAQAADAVWLDSWHMSSQIMQCKATLAPSGAAALLGSYPAPPGPDWGWRIETGGENDGSLSMRMFNITPQGREQIAVLARYLKTGETL